MNVATPDQFAVDFLTDMPIAERDVWSKLLPEVRAVTFTIKLTQQTDSAIKKAQAAAAMEQAKALLATVPAGGDARKVQRQITALLTPFFPTPAQASRRAELLVRHWAGMARAAGWYRTLDRQRWLYPYWKYVTFGDDRVRATHAALNGKIIPASSPFWDTHFPPWAPMCRCMVVPISQDEYDRIRAAELKLPMEKRSIVEGPALDALEKSNTIMTARRYPQPDGSVRYGPATPYSVAPEPGWTGWNPRDLRITEAQLKERYKDAPKELKKMMQKADATEIAPGVTLGDHIRGTKELPSIEIPEAKAKPAPPVAATAPAPASTAMAQAGLNPTEPATWDRAGEARRAMRHPDAPKKSNKMSDITTPATAPVSAPVIRQAAEEFIAMLNPARAQSLPGITIGPGNTQVPLKAADLTDETVMRRKLWRGLSHVLTSGASPWQQQLKEQEADAEAIADHLESLSSAAALKYALLDQRREEGTAKWLGTLNLILAILRN